MSGTETRPTYTPYTVTCAVVDPAYKLRFRLFFGTVWALKTKIECTALTVYKYPLQEYQSIFLEIMLYNLFIDLQKCGLKAW